jgi:hypothetical protein
MLAFPSQLAVRAALTSPARRAAACAAGALLVAVVAAAGVAADVGQPAPAASQAPLTTPPAAATAATATPAAPAAAAASAVSDTAEGAAAAKPAASMAIIFDLVSKDRSLSVEPNTPFEFYVVARNAEGGLTGWEARVLLDKRIAVLERKADGLNVASEDSWRVGLGEDCKHGDEIILAKYKAIVWVKDATDVTIGLGAIDHGSWDPPSTGYLTCMRAGDIRPMAAPQIAAVINPEKIHLDSGMPKGPPSLFTPAREKH